MLGISMGVMSLYLAVLFWVGVATPEWSGWMTWLNFFGSIATALGIALISPLVPRALKAAGPLALAGALFTMSIWGLAAGVDRVQGILNFAAACLFTLIGLNEGRLYMMGFREEVTTPGGFRKTA